MVIHLSEGGGWSEGNFSGYNNFNSAHSQDVAWHRYFGTLLAREGVYFGGYKNFGFGGQTMAGILAGVSDITTYDPTFHIFQGLTNNALLNIWNDTAKDDVIEYIERIFGVGSYGPRTSLQYFVVNIIPPCGNAVSDATMSSTYDDIWEWTLALPTLWDSLHPAEAGKVIIGGNHAATVGYDHSTWVDTGIYSRDNVHWDPAGHISQAVTLFNAV